MAIPALREQVQLLAADLHAQLVGTAPHGEGPVRARRVRAAEAGRLAANPTLAELAALLRSDLETEHNKAVLAGRTAATFDAWCVEVVDGAAAAWVLGCVIIRFCEDNGLVDKVWLGGAETETQRRAMAARQHFFLANPRCNDRDWLREAFRHLSGLRAIGRIFDGHNPVWRFDISGGAAEALSTFFRTGPGSGSLRSSTLDTRFLGDVYAQLSGQHETPEFVAEFILARTVPRAVDEFGLGNFSLLDPACGSGSFLLGAFHRLVEQWRAQEPGIEPRALVSKALSQLTGVDVNPVAVAVTRFRLAAAALKICSYERLSDVAAGLPVRVATGDALMPWADPSEEAPTPASMGVAFAFDTEDEDLLREYLRPGHYTVVVGSPPAAAIRDKAVSDSYRTIYRTATGQFPLSVPFAERFFQLARRADHAGVGAGWVGQLTANSFVKREFGRRLVETFFPSQVELVEVIDTSGAHLPGQSTPTVILVGRNRAVNEAYSGRVRTVIGVRDEPRPPDAPAKGLVWASIVDSIRRPGTETEWVTVADTDRAALATHPWRMIGGGDALSVIEAAGAPLRTIVEHIAASRFAADDALIRPDRATPLTRAGRVALRPLLLAEGIRDWATTHTEYVWCPDSAVLAEELWPWREHLAQRQTLPPLQEQRPAIVSPGVATHNHFVLNRGGVVAGRSTSLITLPGEASEEEHLRLLGLLNSSTACFWLKQLSRDKGNGTVTDDEPWDHRYEFAGPGLEELPVPSGQPGEISRLAGSLDRLALSAARVILGGAPPSVESLAAARQQWQSARGRMIALQEELDWACYRLYGLIDEDLVAPSTMDVPELVVGERAFEIVLARHATSPAWLARHGVTPTSEPPARWPAAYAALVERRVALIESDRNIGLVERPEFKRAWMGEGWDGLAKAALRDWLLDRLEAAAIWEGLRALSLAQLAEAVDADEQARTALDLWAGGGEPGVAKALGDLLKDEHVPYLASLRYKPSGLAKHSAWQATWQAQREQDSGAETSTVDAPPKYVAADFLRPSYWRLRGRVDVPTERFISYPGLAREDDATLLIGWAGWDHAAQAQALMNLYADTPRLAILAGLAELEPWLEPGEGSLAERVTTFIDAELATLGVQRDALP